MAGLLQALVECVNEGLNWVAQHREEGHENPQQTAED